MTGDENKQNLINEFGMAKHPKVFYYLCGLIFASALIGLGGMISSMCCRDSQECRHCNCNGIYCGTLECDGCAGCACDGCSGAQCGEAGPFVLVIIAGLAVIGIVIAIAAGVVFAQKVLQRHMHILHKQELAKEYVVKDLAAADGGIALVRQQMDHDRGTKGTGRGEIGISPPSAPSATAYSPLVNNESYIVGDDRQGQEGLEMNTQPSAPPEISLAQRRELAEFGLL
jgi:hypothetical protein